MPMFRRRPRLRDAAVGGRAHMMGKHREGGQEEERELVLGLGGTPYIVAMGALVVFAAAGFVAALLLPAEPRAASARV
jgi:hypothetical protein